MTQSCVDRIQALREALASTDDSAQQALRDAASPESLREIIGFVDALLLRQMAVERETFTGNIEAVNTLGLDALEFQPVLEAVQSFDISTGRARELLRCWVLGTLDMTMLPPCGDALFLDEDAPREAVEQLRADVAKLRIENERLRRVSRDFGDVIHNHCLAMSAAVIEGDIGKGEQAGLQWIRNTLGGPGLLPNLNEAQELGGAQAWFDAKVAEEAARIAALPPEAEPLTAREFYDAANYLARQARRAGFYLTVTQVPHKPLRMGWHWDCAAVTPVLDPNRKKGG